MLKAYIKYRRRAVNEYSIHSPFVFDFYTDVLKRSRKFDDEIIEVVRRKLLRDNREIEITDMGQGSRKNKSNVRSIAELAKVQSVDRKYGKLLGYIVKYYGLGECLELGTSLGFGAAYMALNASSVITIEGCPNILKETHNAWNQRFGNVSYELGEFSERLPQVLNSIEKLDLAYIDGNHGYEPTLNYFEQILDKAHNDTFIIFDDINWSDGMRKAWDEICASPKIHVSIELFRMGIVLKREEQAKEHFVLRF